MKKFAMCLAPLLFVVACGVDGPDATHSDSDSPTATAPDTARPDSTEREAPNATRIPEAGFGPCGPGSQGICTDQTLGTVCASNPTRFCLPVQNAPNNICRCGTF